MTIEEEGNMGTVTVKEVYTRPRIDWSRNHAIATWVDPVTGRLVLIARLHAIADAVYVFGEGGTLWHYRTDEVSTAREKATAAIHASCRKVEDAIMSSLCGAP